MRRIQGWAALGVVLVGACCAAAAWAADGGVPACEAAAREKKLAGAAKTSFVQKCEKDAQARCEAQASEKKLAGAAKTSFVNKCLRETVTPAQ
ncbi:MAG: hypothetical protein N2Z66_04055 [Tepidimonas sp.]|nr:hypothetical protein [Tepidimonas sp.]